MNGIIKKAGIILSALLLTSCSAKTSSDSDEGMIKSENYGAEISLYTNKIRESNYININTESLVLNCAVPEEMGKYQIICIDGFQKNADLLFEKYVPFDTFDKTSVIDDKTTYPYGPSYEDEISGLSLSVGCTGFFSYYRTSDTVEIDTAVSAASDYVNDSSGYSAAIDNAISTADEFVEEFAGVSGFPNTLRANTVTEYNSDNGNEIVEIKYGTLYKDIPIFSMTSAFNELSFEMAVLPAAAAYYDVDNNQISKFTVQCGFEDYCTTETYSELISPEKALNLLSETLSEHLKYDAIGMELVYCPVYIENVEHSDGMTHREAAPWCSVCSYDVFELTPYWAVYIDVTPSKEVYGLVNCITGEVEFVNNRK